MKQFLYLSAILLMAFACSTNEEVEQVAGQGKAKLQFQLSLEDCPVILTKATAIPDVNDFVIKVTDSEGEEVVEDTLKTLKLSMPLYLTEGDYTVEAYSNKLEDAKLDAPCFYAKTDTTVEENETVTVKLECSLQQFQISLNPSNAFKGAFRLKEDLKEGDTEFKLIVSDENGREVPFSWDELDKSAYFDASKTSSYIKIHIVGTTVKGFPVDFTDTVQPEDKLLERKDHLIIDLNVSETRSMSLEATTVEL